MCTTTSNSSRPSLINNDMVHIGNQYVHHTHKIGIHRGFVYCKKCGGRKGTAVIKKLASACAPPSATGKQTLHAISCGRLPPGVGEWPLSVTT